MATMDEYNPVSRESHFERQMKARNNNCRLILKGGYYHNGFVNRKGFENDF